MSLKKRYAVMCDVCGSCSLFADSATDARKVARKCRYFRYPKEWLKRHGWFNAKGVDRCPDCAAKHALSGKEAPNAVQ